MKVSSVILRVVIGLAFAFWSVQVLAVAVFAVPDRYGGIESVLMSLIVLIGGFAPVAFFMYLFRDRLAGAPATEAFGPAPERSHGAAVRTAEAAAASGDPLVEALSERELEVLTLVARGFSNKEVASQLSVTVGTVKTHTNNINRKLGTRTRTQAIARAREYGLL